MKVEIFPTAQKAHAPAWQVAPVAQTLPQPPLELLPPVPLVELEPVDELALPDELPPVEPSLEAQAPPEDDTPPPASDFASVAPVEQPERIDAVTATDRLHPKCFAISAASHRISCGKDRALLLKGCQASST